MQGDYIAHYGVPGMRWGVRKDRSSGVAKSRTSSTNTGETKPATKKKITSKVKSKVKKAASPENVAKAVAKGAEVTSKILLTSAADDIFYGGAGKRIAKETIKQTGRAAVTAYTMARGGYDIHWYDN